MCWARVRAALRAASMRDSSGVHAAQQSTLLSQKEAAEQLPFGVLTRHCVPRLLGSGLEDGSGSTGKHQLN